MARSTPPPALDPARVAPWRPGPYAALDNPLPAGMRDLLPPEARRQGELARRVLRSFELHGYELVTLPAFEYADVLERGLGTLEADQVLRFVEPDSGAVVALRPDMTPQIARILATRLSELPVPARLCYHGSVLRRQRQRARRNRQIQQAGVELLGLSGPAGDLEVLQLAAASMRAAGLASFVIDLGHARIAGALLENVPAESARELVEALSLKDQSQVESSAVHSGLSGRTLRAVSALPDLHGGDEIWAEAERVLRGTTAEPALVELRQIWDSVKSSDLAETVLVDFCETRHFAYYTGSMFQIHADGPGRPIAAGGRYDALLERFGAPRAAAGFAIGLDDLAWALERAGRVDAQGTRLLLVGAAPALLDALRERGLACAMAPAGDALSYARAWRYTHVLEVSAREGLLLNVSDRKSERVSADADALVENLGETRSDADSRAAARRSV